ncbi:hypothetical protein BDY21DRAFT_338659 [Lineolata rhizophorae]|uniref:C2H2-type domain-containing protein n=1 Tax=Lineolata rhizophorae TaxID=578093 RepID=A0A6A6P708_9PEZI|nr:hypothetical protein BDY21DRAFT_338659 [Lineolata rhizophorae]
MTAGVGSLPPQSERILASNAPPVVNQPEFHSVPWLDPTSIKPMTSERSIISNTMDNEPDSTVLNQCSYCNQIFDSTSLLVPHVNLHHKCRICDSKFHKAEERELHEKQHTCCGCNTTFRSIEECNEHQLSHCKCDMRGSDLEDATERVRDQHGHMSCDFCEFRGHNRETVRVHEEEVHTGILHRCSECGMTADSKSKIKRHARYSGHSPYKCHQSDCIAAFSRVDVYKRHMLSHKKDARGFPCTECDRYQGPKVFKRYDHLTQHMQKTHNVHLDTSLRYISNVPVCPHKTCADYRDLSLPSLTPREMKPFKARSEWTAHMRTEHKESPFPCAEPGCDRKEGKGYFRKRDLVKHMKAVHNGGE